MTQPVLEKMAAQRAKLNALIADLPEEKLDLSLEGGWTIRQILTHLLSTEDDHCKMIQAFVQGRADRIPQSLDLDEYNARRLAEQERLTLAQLKEGLAQGRRKTEALFNSLSADQLALRGRHPFWGDQSSADIFRILAVHDQTHTREIAAILKGQN